MAEAGSGPNILVVLNDFRAPAGVLGECILARQGYYLSVAPGVGYSARAPDEYHDLPDSDAGFDGLVVLGGPQSAGDDDGNPYFRRLMEAIREFHAADKPVMGVCLGGQLVARAFGAAPSIRRVVVTSSAENRAGIERAIDAAGLAKVVGVIDGGPSRAHSVLNALDVLEGQGQGPFDAVVIVQPSSPFTLGEDIDATVELLAESGADTVVTVMQLDHAVHPLKMKILDGDRLLPYLEDERGRMAAHELPAVYVRNCSVYATRRSAIDRGQMIGDDCRAYVMPRERSLDINEELDLQFAEFLVARKERK